MSISAGRIRMSLWGVIVVLVVVLLAFAGGLSPAAAVDRWVGTITIEGVPVAFTVLVNPGVSASWEWRVRGVQVASGFLAASVNGSQVTGTLFTTGGAIFEPGVCCRPCNFSGTIAGNVAQGTFDAVSCDGSASWVLVKQ